MRTIRRILGALMFWRRPESTLEHRVVALHMRDAKR